jgi:DNA-binding CsgD family transcriptional regulator
MEIDTDPRTRAVPPIGVSFVPAGCASGAFAGPAREDARMSRLPDNRVEQVVRALGDLASVADFEGFADAAIRAADTVVDSDVTTFNDVDIGRGTMLVRTRPADFVYPPGAAELLAQHADEHPLIRHLDRTGDGSAMRISDLVSAREFHESLLYREIYGRIGVEDQMAITLPSPRDHAVAVVVSRGRRSFTEADRSALDLLRPYLAQTYRLLRERETLRHRLDATRVLLAQSDVRAFALGDAPEDVTPGALVLLYRFFGRPGSHSALPDRVEAWLRRERAKLAEGATGHAELLAPLLAHRDDQQLVARFIPGHGDPDVVALRQMARGEPSSQQLELYRLTRREAEVADLLMSGRTNRVIGEELHIAPGTVKKHLDHIYRKLGATNRVAAVRTLLDLHASR